MILQTLCPGEGHGHRGRGTHHRGHAQFAALPIALSDASFWRLQIDSALGSVGCCQDECGSTLLWRVECDQGELDGTLKSAWLLELCVAAVCDRGSTRKWDTGFPKH